MWAYCDLKFANGNNTGIGPLGAGAPFWLPARKRRTCDAAQAGTWAVRLVRRGNLQPIFFSPFLNRGPLRA